MWPNTPRAGQDGTIHCTALSCTVLHWAALHWTELYCTVLHCTELYWTLLHCAALHCTATTILHTALARTEGRRWLFAKTMRLCGSHGVIRQQHSNTAGWSSGWGKYGARGSLLVTKTIPGKFGNLFSHLLELLHNCSNHGISLKSKS